MISAGMLPGILLVLQASGPGWQPAPPLPRPVTGSAVTAIETPGGAAVFSFFGEGRDPSEPGGRAYRWDVGSEGWIEMPSIPGPGRISATAVTVGGRVLVLGGWSVGEDGMPVVLGRVDRYDPASDTWSSGRPMPVPSGEAIAAVWRDSLVYVVGPEGGGAEGVLVQIYDPASDAWLEAAPDPVGPLSAHAGSVARDAFILLGQGEEGAGPSTWRGDIDPREPTRIRWRRLGDPGGPHRPGAAAVAIGTRVIFVGGGDASRMATRETLVYNLVTDSWRTAEGPGFSSRDHGLVRAAGWLVLVGGTTESAVPTDRVWRISVLDAIAAGR